MTFKNDMIPQLRVEVDNDEIWFCAGDVCRALGIKPEQVRRLDEDEKTLRSADTNGGPQRVVFVNEPGLYALILGSSSPKVKDFKRWVTHDVIPSIRRTGAYLAKPQYLDVPGNPAVRKNTADLRRAIACMSTVLDIYNRYRPVDRKGPQVTADTIAAVGLYIEELSMRFIPEPAFTPRA